MKKFLIMLMLMLLPLAAQAEEGMTWHETNDPYLDMSFIHFAAGSYEFADGTKCKVLLFKQNWGSYYQAGGPDCDSPSAEGGGTKNGATVNIDNSKTRFKKIK